MFKILKDFKGSPDGYTVIEYATGQELDLPPSLAEVALAEKWAKPLPAKAKPAPVVEPSAPVAPAVPLDDAAAEAIADAQAAEAARAAALANT